MIYRFYLIFTVTDHNIVYMFVNMTVKKKNELYKFKNYFNNLSNISQ